ncbi:MAG: V-type ATP synthase subunit E [Saccharolobus sp.]|uniref:A-type ATP synthase subunit E n=1 Tax=Saccharolobus shibatae (strain ATCC 51178 / DSM 5389 / JCM 8931 / NBRC 15437 / B12) TaxID=523848 RepID=A0A8F5BRE2_SACSH|nr:V-type ATP synthase subunit E [Saccharolobus shibatae]MCH4814781.1 V-type ATP synthase subunit E [Saccharolobus shibatae]QXJ29950.1 V-type ATP synthase subunit E [Saccharolobus shibatae B12]
MDFEQLLDKSLNKVREEIKTELSKSLDEAIKLLNEGHTKIIQEYTQRINELIAKTKEEIEGEKARLEVENKRTLLVEKEYWINKVYERVLEKIGEVVKTKEYKDAIQSILNKEIKEMEGEKITVYCSPNDKSTVEKVVGNNKNVTIKTDDKMLGGIRIYYEGSGLTRDFSLKLILDQVFDSMRGKISDMLFGGK